MVLRKRLGRIEKKRAQPYLSELPAGIPQQFFYPLGIVPGLFVVLVQRIQLVVYPMVAAAMLLLFYPDILFYISYT